MKVFFSREMGDYVVDEKCVCGHPKREHGSVLKKINHDRSVRIPHDGNCCKGKCRCKSFKWAGWVTATEAAAAVPAGMFEEAVEMV